MNKKDNSFWIWMLSIVLVIGSTILLTTLVINFDLNYGQQVVIGMCSVFPAMLFQLSVFNYHKSEGK